VSEAWNSLRDGSTGPQESIREESWEGLTDGGESFTNHQDGWGGFLGESEAWDGSQGEQDEPMGGPTGMGTPTGDPMGTGEPMGSPRGTGEPMGSSTGIGEPTGGPTGEPDKPIDQFCSSCNQKKLLIDFGRFLTYNPCRQRNRKANRARHIKQKALLNKSS
jgi:hypothetical protein